MRDTEPRAAGDASRALVGREAEQGLVVDAIEHDRPVLVFGEPGIGKTALIRAAIADTGRPLYEGGAFATLSWKPNLALERAVGRPLRGDADWVAGEVERIVGPDVLFVDDAQWADPGTLEAVARLVSRVSVVVASRLGDAGTEAVRSALAPVKPVTLTLAPLSSAEGARIAVAIRPSLGPDRATALAERAGGNPFLIETLAATGVPTASLRRAVAARLDVISGVELADLRLLAVADRPLPRGEIAAFDRLLQDGFAVGVGPDIAIRHALLADAVLADIEPDEALHLHRRLADIVAADGERARHLAAADDPAAAHVLALRAAAAASSPGERAAQLGLAAATASGMDANALRIAAASALRVAGDLDAARQALESIEDADPETIALAEATRARICWSSGDPNGMRAAIERGLAFAGGTGSAAEALLRAEAVTVTALVDGRFDEGLTDAGAAVELARRAGADPTRALLLRATILAGLGRPGWDAALEAVVDAARASGDVETELSAANNLVTGHEMHGRPEAGRVIAAAMLDRSAALHLTAWVRQFSAMVASLDFHAGSLERAVRRAEALLEEVLDPLATQQAGLVAALSLVDLGRHEEAAVLLGRLLETAAPDVTGRGDVLFALAEAALWGGRPEVALDHLERYLEYAGSEYPTSFLVEVTAGWAALDAGRQIPARFALGEPAGMLAGARLERDALERLAAGDVGAATTFDAAAAAYGGFHRRGELRARWAAAETRRRAGDAAAAEAALEALEPALVEDGFAPLLGRVHRSLRLLGVRRATRLPTADLPSRLTARELEIAVLVGRGLTNQEIARRLGLGRPTVARLLSNAMLKVGVDSRGQLAARQAEFA